jgi:glycosyltransferase involved in cell wall biosynthesis
MRVVMNTMALGSTGGIELTAFQMARELAARGHPVSVLGTGGGDLEQSFRAFAEHVSVHGNFQHTLFSPGQLRAPGDLVRWSLQMTSAVEAARRSRPDVVYANAFFSLPWALATAAVTHSGIVCHLHGGAGGPVGRQAALWARWVDSFVAPSQFIRDDWVRNGLSAERVKVITGGVDPGDYPFGDDDARAAARQALGLPPDTFIALFLGRIVPEKGVESLLEAWRRLGLDRADGRLVIVGPGHPGYLRALAAGTDATFLPPSTDVLTPLHAADVVVVPSLWEEPFGRVVIEAMVTGRPVLASRSGGIPEILTGRFAGHLFEKGDATELAALLRGLIGWRDREPGLAARCAAHVEEHFQLSDRVDGVEALLGQAAGAHHRRAGSL